MSDGLALAKTVWTDADFEVMGWHDNAVHAIAVEPALPHPGSLLLDIDHIVEWGPCPVPGGSLSFWVCPATLVFHQAWDLVTDINLRGWSFRLSIAAIERSGPDEHGSFAWTIEGDLFTMSLSAAGFPSACAARPSTRRGSGCRPGNGEGSASTSTATPADPPQHAHPGQHLVALAGGPGRPRSRISG